MPVARIHKTKDFTVMSNIHFREKKMSLKAKGLLSLMLSLPDEWDYSIAGLVTLSKDGKDSVMKALTELEEFGYLKRTRVTKENGQFAGYDYDIYEKPIAVEPNTEKPYEEKPYAENPPQYITKELNTKESNIKVSNTDYKAIIDFLNAKAETSYRASTKATQQLIKARMHEGFTTTDFITVIEKKCAEWKGDAKMEQYLRPATLFGTKFESYLNAPIKVKKTYGATGVEIQQPEGDDVLAGII